MSGLGGNDRVVGDNGDDRLYGGDSNDALDGGHGNDLLNGDRDNDQLFAGLGNDVFAFTSHTDPFGAKIGAGTDIVWDFKVGDDRLQLGGASDVITIAGKEAFSANIDGDMTTGVNGVDSGTKLTLDHGGAVTSTVYLVGITPDITDAQLLVA